MTQLGGILSGPEIRKQIQEGRITIEPFEEHRIGPGSIDLTLGSNVQIYRGSYEYDPLIPRESDGCHIRPATNYKVFVRDSKKTDHWKTDSFEIDPEKGWVLKPGIGYLMHTAERVTTNHFIPVLDGKSSLGRIFVKVHETAGYGDPGFDGQYTLEVTSQLTVRVYPGMRFCQMRFHSLVGDPMLYQDHRSNYKGVYAKGAVASRVYKQFD